MSPRPVRVIPSDLVAAYRRDRGEIQARADALDSRLAALVTAVQECLDGSGAWLDQAGMERVLSDALRAARGESDEDRAAAEWKLAALVRTGSALVESLESDSDHCRVCGEPHPTAHRQSCPIGNFAAALRGEDT